MICKWILCKIFIDATISWVSRIVLSAVWTFHFIWTLFLGVVWVHFSALCTCQSSSESLPVMSIFFYIWSISRLLWYIVPPLEAVADVHFFGNMGLIECQNVGVGLDLWITLSDWNSQGFCHLLYCSYFWQHLYKCSVSRGNLPYVWEYGSFLPWRCFRPAFGCPLRQVSFYFEFSLRFVCGGGRS